jgi:hypothetical protein
MSRRVTACGSLAAIVAILAAAAPVADAAPPPPAPPAYVATYGANDSLAVVDGPAYAKVAATAPTHSSVDVVVSPDGAFVYVLEQGASQGEGYVVKIDAKTRDVRKRVRIADQPGAHAEYLVISPDGMRVYASAGLGAVAYDTAELAEVGRVRGVGVGQMQISSDGATIYASANLPPYDNVITVLNAKDLSVRKTIGPKRADDDDYVRAQNIALAPDGKTLYAVVQHFGNGSGDDISIETVGTTAPYAFAKLTNRVGDIRFAHLLTSLDGKQLYVFGESAQVIDLRHAADPGSATEVTGTRLSHGMAYTPDGARLVTTAWSDRVLAATSTTGTFDVIDTGTNAATGHVDVGNAGGVAVTPDQAPVAKLAVSAGAPGAATTLNASASTVRFGTIASYRWDFGDGSTAVTSTTAKVSHTYAKAGSYSVRVTETSSAGTSTSKVFTGRMTLRNGGPSATTTAAVSIVADPHSGAGGPAPSKPGLAATGPSDLGRNVGTALLCLVVGSGLILIGRRRYLARHR